MGKILATNIQRFSLHDGPGIRTTVFLKGCSLHCPWCSNPENINAVPEKYIRDGKEHIYGQEYTADELFMVIMKDKAFYEPDGGVTFSGGEPLLQADRILPVLRKSKEAGITTAIETCLFAPKENVELLIPYIDFFYVDVKILDEVLCKIKLLGNLSIYKENLDFLCSQKKITIRVPVIGGYTDDPENRKKIAGLIAEHRDSVVKVELLKEHNLGKSKYLSLGWKVPELKGVSDSRMIQYKKALETAVDIPVEICM